MRRTPADRTTGRRSATVRVRGRWSLTGGLAGVWCCRRRRGRRLPPPPRPRRRAVGAARTLDGMMSGPGQTVAAVAVSRPRNSWPFRRRRSANSTEWGRSAIRAVAERAVVSATFPVRGPGRPRSRPAAVTDSKDGATGGRGRNRSRSKPRGASAHSTLKRNCPDPERSPGATPAHRRTHGPAPGHRRNDPGGRGPETRDREPLPRLADRRRIRNIKAELDSVGDLEVCGAPT